MILAHTSPRPATIRGTADDSSVYDALSPALRAALDFWVSLAVLPAPSPDRSRSSETMAHDFERATGLHVTNGAIKGAMVNAGYAPLDRAELSWHFRTCPTPRRRRPVDGTPDGYSINHVSTKERTHLGELATAAKAEAAIIRREINQ